MGLKQSLQLVKEEIKTDKNESKPLKTFCHFYQFFSFLS